MATTKDKTPTSSSSAPPGPDDSEGASIGSFDSPPDAAPDSTPGAATPEAHRKAVKMALTGLQAQIDHVRTLRIYHTEGKPISLASLDALRDKLEEVSQSLSAIS